MFFLNFDFFLNLADILKICKLDGEDAICQLANIGFWIQITLIPMIVISNPFLHKMPVLLKLSDFSHILSWLLSNKSLPARIYFLNKIIHVTMSDK